MLVMSLALAWVLPLSAGARLTSTGELRDVTGIVVSGDVGITHIDDELWLQMPLSLYGRKLPRRHTITVTPRLVADTDSTDFPEMIIYGRWAYYDRVRRSCDDASDAQRALHCRADHAANNIIRYARAMEYRPWMAGATLYAVCRQTDACGNIVRQWRQTLVAPTMLVSRHTTTTVTPAPVVVQPSTTRDVELQQRQGSAYVDFPVNRVEVVPAYHDNQRELDRICSLIDSLRADTTLAMQRVTLTGYASPEGSYANNERLARGRVHAMRDYITAHCALSADMVSTDYVAEDWQGLRAYIEASSLDGRDDLLRIMAQSDDPDRRLTAMASSHPAAYRHLADSVFPRLRRTDYRIDYVMRHTVERQMPHTATAVAPTTATTTTGTETTTTAVLPIADATAAPQADDHRMHTYRPLFALKSNILFDALLAPNIEVEVALGRRQRWSIMAEVWCPWWRFGHNSAGDANPYRRTDQRPTRHSYQLLTVGIEGRYWLAPRCDAARPTLTGAFIGVYAAGGKYDLGYDSEGRQGEFTSFGISGGYSWPISRHWNLELSAALGYIGGPQVRYQNEFDDARLIYRSHQDHWHYFGPTKAKVSFVWLIGAKSKKGGAL